MSVYILDTDMLTLFQFNHPRVRQRVASHSPDELAVTIISVEEQVSGWYTQLRRAKKRETLARVYQRMTDNVTSLASLHILTFSEPAIVRFEELRKLKLGVGKTDLRIAAITLEHGEVLATRIVSDFRRVPGLVIQNWADE
jgi:tRNA(fMet)-specific endonuclease VapC